MAIPGWTVYVDWDNSGDFTDRADKDVSAYLESMEFEQGIPEPFTEEYVATQALLALENRDGYFVEGNPNTIFRSQIAAFDTGASTWVPFTNAGADQRLAQSTRLATARQPDLGFVELKRTGTPGGTAVLEIWSDAVGVPSARLDAYAVSNPVSIDGISAAGEYVEFTFPTPPDLDDSTTYHQVLILSGYTRTAGLHELSWGMNGASGYEGGHASTWNGTSWSWRNNGISNPSFEVNTTGWSGLNGTTLTRVTTDGYDGSACLQVDPPGAVGTEGALFGGGAVAASPSTAYTFRVAIKGTPGLSYRLAWDENNGGAYLRTKTSGALTLVGSGWNWFELSATTGASVTNVNLYAYHDAVNATRFYLDKAQFSADSAPQGDFHFRLSSSDILRGRRVKIQSTYSATNRYHWFGYVESWAPDTDPAAPMCTVTAIDPFERWKNVDVKLPIQTNYRLAPDAVYNVCNLVLGLTATQVSLGDDGTALVHWFTHLDKAATVLERLREAGAAKHWIKAVAAPDDFKYVWRNRFAENSVTSSEDWTLTVDNIVQRSPTAQLRTKAVVKARPLVVQALTDVWTYNPVPESWGASENRTILADLEHPCTSVTAPASGTDYTPGFTVTVVNTYAQMVELSVTAPGGGGTLALLKIRGTPAVEQSTIPVEYENARATAVHGEELSPIEIDNELLQTWTQARGVGSTLVQRNSRPLRRLQVRRVNEYPSMLAREIGDKITLTLTQLGIDSLDFVIDGMVHRVSKTTHECDYNLREAERSQDWFQLDVRGLDRGKLAPG